MPNVFHVDTADLAEAANKLRAVEADLRSAHESVHERIEGLVAEFGQSATAAALQQRVADMRAETHAHCNGIIEHHHNYRSAAKGYEETEDRTRNSIRGV